MNKDFDLKSIDRSTLRDISGVKIDTALPREDRVKSYVEQIGNPYCYLDGDIVISIGYADTPVSLQDRLKSFVCSLG